MKFILASLILSFSAMAHNNDNLRAYHLIRPDTKTMDAVADDFEVVKKLSNGFEVYVPVSKMEQFLKLAPNAELVLENDMKGLNLEGYRTYDSVSAELIALQIQYPDLVKLETYGTTNSGHKLYALKISDNVKMDEDEPEIMITSATHGDEIITVEVEMELILTLLKNYDKDPRLTKMINDHELFFIPMVNPQGYSRRDRYARNTDPNRDYPYPGVEEKQSVDCIDSIRKFFHAHDFKGSIDLHAYGKLVMFPWGYTKTSPPAVDEANFQYLTSSMAEINKYEAGQISKIIYVAKGSSADYYYWKNKTLALGIELSTSKAPPFRSVAKVVEESKEMIWRFIEHF
jgi:succinylglutamate desuccinylase